MNNSIVQKKKKTNKKCSSKHEPGRSNSVAGQNTCDNDILSMVSNINIIEQISYKFSVVPALILSVLVLLFSVKSTRSYHKNSSSLLKRLNTYYFRV